METHIQHTVNCQSVPCASVGDDCTLTLESGCLNILPVVYLYTYTFNINPLALCNGINNMKYQEKHNLNLYNLKSICNKTFQYRKLRERLITFLNIFIYLQCMKNDRG